MNRRDEEYDFTKSMISTINRINEGSNKRLTIKRAINEARETGADAIAEWDAELEKAGILTEQEVETGTKLDNTLKNFKKTVQKLIAENGEELTELMTSLLETAKALTPCLTAIAKGLTALGPAGTVALGVFIAMMSALPTLIVMLNSMNLAAKQYASAIMSFAALALVAPLGAAALVAIGQGNGSESKNPTVDYSSLAEETEDLTSKTQDGGNVTNTNNDDHSVVVEDNSTNNYYISEKIDADEVIEQITDARRGLIGG